MKIFMNCFDFFGKAIEQYVDAEFTYFFSDKGTPSTRFIRDYFDMKKKLKSGELDKYDIVHVANWFNFLLIKYKKPHQIWIAESHGFHFGLDYKKALADSAGMSKFLGGVIGRIWHRKIKNAIQKFDKHIVAIPNIEESAKKVRPDSKWIPNPIKTNFFISPEKISLDGKPSIFFPTRLHKMKEPEVGLQIFSRIASKYPAAKLHLIKYPSGMSQYSLYSEILKKYEANIIWHEFIPRDKLLRFYHSSDIVLGAFGKGLLNLVELEAMACGSIVVSWDKYEFIKKDLDELSDFAIKLLEDKEFRDAYRKKSKEYVRRIHGADNVAKVYKQLINSAIDEARRKNSKKFAQTHTKTGQRKKVQ